MPPAPPSTPRTDNGADPACAICGGLGRYSLNVPTHDPRFGRLFPCDCTAAWRAARLQELSGLYGEERNVMLSDIIDAGPGTRAMIEAGRVIIEQPRGILTLWGTCGNAKTLVLQGVVNECIARGIDAVYVTMLDLIEYIREAYQEGQEGINGSAWQRMDRFTAVRVLAIDECDKVKRSEWVLERQTAIFDKRHRLGLAGHCGTMLAMNADPNDPAVMPDWISSRLNDGRNRIIHNADPDMRRLMK
jgi:hypothetical protein